MINAPGVVILAALFLIGPFGVHHLLTTLLVFGLITAGLATALASRRSSRGQTIALLVVLAVLSYQSLQSITAWLRLEMGRVPMFGGGVGLHLVFTIDVGLAMIGVAAAGVLALFLEVKKTRLPLAKLFPSTNFVSAPIELRTSVEEMSKIVGVRPPTTSLIDSGDPAAFITRSRGGFELALSVGLLESLTKSELDACIAHELSHVKNNDFAIRSFATSARVALFAHPLSHLIEPAIYRAREFLADETAVEMTGDRGSLISALAKIRESQDYVTSESGSVATACLFDSSRRTRLLRLLDKHPTLDARIKALRFDPS